MVKVIALVVAAGAAVAGTAAAVRTTRKPKLAPVVVRSDQ